MCNTTCVHKWYRRKQGLSPITYWFRLKTTVRCCKHGDEESEDFYKGGRTQTGNFDEPQVTQIGGFDLERNKTWQIHVVADPNKLLRNLICYNYVGGNASSGGRKIFISKEKLTNWLNQRNIHSNIGEEKESSDDRLVHLEDKTEKLRTLMTTMDAKLDAIFEELVSSTTTSLATKIERKKRFDSLTESDSNRTASPF